MKKTFKLLSFTLILTLIAGVFLFTGCEKVEKDGKDNSFKAIKDKGEMVIGVDDEFAPMGFKDKDGNLVGFDIDLAKLVCKKLGVKAKIKAIPWDTKEIQLQSGDIDAIWNGYTITSESNGKVEFSKPYMNNQQVVAVLDKSSFKSTKDLAGKVMGAQVESAGLEALKADKELGKNKIKSYDTYQDALLDLETSGNNAVVIDKVYIGYAMQQKAGVFRVLPETLSDELYGIGFKKGNIKLRKAVDKALDELYSDGSVEKISKEWFGENIVVRNIKKQSSKDLKNN